MIRTDILIIGAGLSGLIAAHYLANDGKKVQLIEKSKSPGGRLSTRCTENGDFDHGAQYITSRSQEFTGLINHFATKGDITPWKPTGKDSSRAWWTGQPGMSSFGKALAEGLTIDFGARATKISKDEDGTRSVTTQNLDGAASLYQAAKVVVAIPAPQAQELLLPIDESFAPLRNVKMAPCWATMVTFDRALEGIPDVIRGEDVIAFLARNVSKPGRTGETYILHATPQWSTANLESERAHVVAEMLLDMQSITKLGANLPRPIHIDIHRWRYAMVQSALGQPFIGNKDNTLFACGDWCFGPRAEFAHQSGMALARHIIAL